MLGRCASRKLPRSEKTHFLWRFRVAWRKFARNNVRTDREISASPFQRMSGHPKPLCHLGATTSQRWSNFQKINGFWWIWVHFARILVKKCALTDPSWKLVKFCAPWLEWKKIANRFGISLAITWIHLLIHYRSKNPIFIFKKNNIHDFRKFPAGLGKTLKIIGFEHTFWSESLENGH